MRDETGLYTVAKDVLSSLGLMNDTFINVNDVREARIFRKHLSEMILRTASHKRYTTRLLDGKQLRVIRIR